MNIDIVSLLHQYRDVFIAILAFLLGLAFAHIWCGSKRRKEEEDKKKLESYVKGINYIIEDETDKAIKELTETAQMDPDLIDIYISIGNLFRKKGEINRALIIHKSLLAKKDLSKQKKLDLYITVGVDYRKAGLYDRAKKYLKDALSVDPKNQQARRLLYEVYEDSKDWENALEWHKRFSRGDDERLAHIYAELGKEKLKEGQLLEARKNLKKAIKIDETCIDALIHLGDVHMLLGEVEEAYALWEKVCRIKPEFANIALKRIKDVERLKEIIKKLLVEMGDNRYILYFCANQLFDIGEREKAISLYRKLIKLGTVSRNVLKRLTIAYKGDLPDVIAEIVQQEPLKDVKYTCTSCGYTTYTLSFRCPKCRKWDRLKVEIV